jgi:hypothetical protein
MCVANCREIIGDPIANRAKGLIGDEAVVSHGSVLEQWLAGGRVGRWTMDDGVLVACRW